MSYKPRKARHIEPAGCTGLDYRRWLGLGLFCGTVVVTLLLRRVASNPTNCQVWGNLGTEEGVDELLGTGWKVKGMYGDLRQDKIGIHR
jgi:hypothetical protein